MSLKNDPETWDARAGADTSWEAAMWSQESQRRRFELVVEWLRPVANEGDRLLDFGCGTGALADELAPLELQLFAWDWSPAMRLRTAREHPEVSVLEAPPAEGLVELFDHVVAVGPFNLADGWSTYATREELARLWAITSKSLTVSLYRGQLHAGMLRYDAGDLLRIHERLGYPRLTLSNEHLHNDWMIRFVRSQA